MSRRNTLSVHGDAETPTSRFLRIATRCRTRDLKQLYVLGELAKSSSELIHALQKERGASSIFLGSNGTQFAEQLAARVAESESHERRVHHLLEHVDEKLDQISAGARFYARVALVFRALDSLPSVRAQISMLATAPKDAFKTFTEIIACLLAVGFEAADVAADPQTSRALVALVNFAQGKEYAGQERATAGAALSRGELAVADRQRLRQLQTAQSAAFQVFLEFADPACVAGFLDLTQSADMIELQRMRNTATDPGCADNHGVTADAWYEVTTRRIDRMKVIEDQLAANLQRLCTLKLAEAESDAETNGQRGVGGDALKHTTAVAMLVTDMNPSSNNLGVNQGIGMFSMRSILDVVKAQSQRIDDISLQLESARVALAERKIIERAKGILTRSRRLSEQDAYTLIRQTAMKQNKRVIEVAEAIVSMADILKS